MSNYPDLNKASKQEFSENVHYRILKCQCLVRAIDEPKITDCIARVPTQKMNREEWNNNFTDAKELLLAINMLRRMFGECDN